MLVFITMFNGCRKGGDSTADVLQRVFARYGDKSGNI